MFRAIDEQTFLRWGYALAGLMFLAAAVLSAELAVDHLTGLGMICGASAPHCGWCYAAAASAVMGLASLAVAFRPAAAEARSAGPRF